MINNNLFEKIKTIFVEILNCDESIITESSSANDIEGWDSLSHIKLVLEIEKEFNVKFSLGELQDLKNIKGLVELVESKI